MERLTVWDGSSPRAHLLEENAVLKRALEMTCEYLGDLDLCLTTCGGSSCTKSCKKCLKKYFIERARDEMQKEEMQNDAC